MNKETWDKKPQETTEAQEACARAEDLVAYLYGEASASEAQDFERHMRNCAPCQTEFNAFGHVRASIEEWRKQSLGYAASPAYEANATAPVREATGETRERKRSALAALREFFTLSPMWMRAGMTAAAVAVCALVTIAAVNGEVRWDDGNVSFRTGLSRERVVEITRTVPVQTGLSEKELQEKIEARAQELAALRQKDDGMQITPASERLDLRPAKRRSAAITPRNIASDGQAPQQLPRSVPRSERQLMENPDEDLPRLSDLFGETR